MFSNVCLRFLWFPWSVYFLCGFYGFHACSIIFGGFHGCLYVCEFYVCFFLPRYIVVLLDAQWYCALPPATPHALLFFNRLPLLPALFHFFHRYRFFGFIFSFLIFIYIHRDLSLCASFLVRIAGGGAAPLFLFRPNTYIGTCMSIEHIYMRLQGSRERYIE